MLLSQTLTKLRRFLRDPDGTIWTDADILTYWNDAQIEVAQKTLILSQVEAHHYPPEYNFTYTHDWEKQFCEGDSYCPFEQSMTRAGLAFCHVWESAYYLDTVSTSQPGYRITHPWEAAYVNPDGFIPIPLHEQLDRMMFCAFNRLQIEPASRKEISESTPYYQTQIGLPQNYWRVDEFNNQIVMYPHPAMILRNYGYTDILSDPADGDSVTSSTEEWLDLTDTGLITDIINLDNSLFMVYQAIPRDLSAWTDEVTLPPWIMKCVECAALERAYGSDTDGFIPTLRDYWKMRKDIQLKLIGKFKTLRLTDRDFVMGSMPKVRQGRGGKLPSHYPAV